MMVDGSSSSSHHDHGGIEGSLPLRTSLEDRDICLTKNRHRKRIPMSLQLFGDDDDDGGHETDRTTSSISSGEEEDGPDPETQRHRRRRLRRLRRSYAPPVPWSNDRHQEFVKAIFEIGLEKSSPTVIAEQMITLNKNFRNNNNAPELPSAAFELHEHYQRELTGERLKSHLQKVRKQKQRQTTNFLDDHRRFLGKQQTIDRKRQELANRERDRRAEARRRRRKRKRRGPASDHNDDDDIEDEETTREEEERLLSLYLPRQVFATGDGSDYDYEDDETEGRLRSAFPAGGNAIGMVTWAVKQEEIEDQQPRKRRPGRKPKSKRRDGPHHVQQQQQQQHQQSPQPRDRHQPLSAESWETASVNSRTIDIAIAAGNAAAEDDDSSDSDSDFEDDEDRFQAPVPTLTEAEKNSPLGVSMMLAWDMIQHMHGVIAEQRSSSQQKAQQAQQQQQQQQQEPHPPPPETADAASTPVRQPSPDQETANAADRSRDGSSMHDGAQQRQSRGLESHPSPVRVAESSVFPTAAQIAAPVPELPTTMIPASILLPNAVSVVSNSSLLAAMAATGPPPTGFAQALGTVLGSAAASTAAVTTTSSTSSFGSNGDGCGSSHFTPVMKPSAAPPLLLGKNNEGWLKPYQAPVPLHQPLARDLPRRNDHHHTRHHLDDILHEAHHLNEVFRATLEDFPQQQPQDAPSIFRPPQQEQQQEQEQQLEQQQEQEEDFLASCNTFRPLTDSRSWTDPTTPTELMFLSRLNSWIMPRTTGELGE